MSQWSVAFLKNFLVVLKLGILVACDQESEVLSEDLVKPQGALSGDAIAWSSRTEGENFDLITCF